MAKKAARRRKDPEVLTLGPLKMRLDPFCRPTLKNMTVRESTERALSVVAEAINHFYERVAIDIGTHDPEKVERAVARLRIRFSQRDQSWPSRGRK